MSDDRDQLMRDLADSLDDTSEAPETAPLPSLDLGPGVYPDVSIEAYISDPCAEASLRSSDLRMLLRMAPAHFRAHHPRLSEKPAWAMKKATRQMNAGTIVHAIVLGKGAAFTTIDPTAYTTQTGEQAKGETKAYRADVAAAQARGLIVLKPKVSDAVERTANALREHLTAALGRAIEDHAVEQTLIWEEKTAYGPVLCRTRPDLIGFQQRAAKCVEIKTTGLELDNDGVERILSANDGGYLMQAAWQLRGIAANFPRAASDIEHSFLFGEMSYPNLVAPITTSKLALEQAGRRCQRAVEKYAELRESGEFASWQPRIGSLSAWLEKAWMEEEGDIETS